MQCAKYTKTAEEHCAMFPIDAHCAMFYYVITGREHPPHKQQNRKEVYYVYYRNHQQDC